MNMDGYGEEVEASTKRKPSSIVSKQVIRKDMGIRLEKYRPG